MTITGATTANAHDALQKGIAERLTVLASEVEEIGVNLCTDMAVATNHYEKLQGIDRIAQNLRELNDVLLAPDTLTAIGSIAVQDLKEHLEAALSNASAA